MDTASGSLGLRESSSAATSATSASSAAAGAADFDDGVDKAAQSRLESSIIAAVDSAANAEKATAGVTDDDTGTLGKTEYGYVEEVKPDAATTAAMSVRQKAEEEVKRQLEETATRAAAKSRGVDWKAMVNVDDGEEPFYGVYEKPKKKQDPKYITKPGEEPYYASIDEAEEALVAKQGLARAAAEEKARAKREKRRARRERKRREREIEESADYFDDDGGGDSGNGDDALEPEYDSDGFECERPSTLGYSDRMKRRSGAARLGSAPRDDFEFAFFRELRDGDLAARGLAALGAAPEAAGGAAGIGGSLRSRGARPSRRRRRSRGWWRSSRGGARGRARGTRSGALSLTPSTECSTFDTVVIFIRSFAFSSTAPFLVKFRPVASRGRFQGSRLVKIENPHFL